MPLPLTPPATDALHFASTQFAPSLYTRAQFDAHYPALAVLQADLQGVSSDNGQEPQAMCAMTQRRHFAPLIDELGSTMPVLVFFLPQAFERFLPQLVMTEILVHNWTALDLSKNMTYCSWYVHENQAEAKEAIYWGIWLPEHVYRAYEQESAAQSADPMAMIDGEAVLHPVIWVAGETVAVGSFWEDVWLQVQISLTERTAREHGPKCQTTDQQQADAKRQAANPAPWQHQMHTIASNGMWPRQHVIEPAAYDCRDWQP